MALLTLTTLSLGIAVAGDALGSGIAGALAGGVSGNYAHEAFKGALQAVAELAQQDQLFANHVLLRAVRRSHLRATRYGVEQFRLSFAHQPADQVRHLAAWCDLISTWLDAEVAETRSGSYRLPHPELLAEQAAQLAHRPEGETADALRDALASQVLALLLDELRDWHEEEAASRRLMPNLPEGFLDMLAQGWLSQPLPEPALQLVLRWFWRKRGAGAKQVQRRQARLAAAGRDAGHTTWFAVYAAFFAHELHADPAVQAAFTNKLLTHLVLRSTPEAAAAAFRDELGRWGAGFCSHIEKLGARLDAGQVQLLAELARAQTLAARDSLVLAATAEAVNRIDVRTAEMANDLAALRERVQAPVAHRRPRQLPPRAIENSFTGRSTALEALVQRLQDRAPVSYVQGPAGFGKTALAAEALSRCEAPGQTPLDDLYPDGVVYLDLYLLEARADAVWTALADALLGAGVKGQLAPEQRAHEACAGQRVLIVLEGAERADGVDGAMSLGEFAALLAPENHRLVLTRESLQTLPAQTIRLDAALEPDEASDLFDRLATPPPPPAVREQVLALLEGHPLALTWAASLVVDPAENPQQLLDDWRREALPSLANPQEGRRTLAWVFERSTRHLEADALRALEALGLLAHAPVGLAAMVAALGLPAAGARAALARLVRAALLRHRVSGADESWQFSHVLAHGFAQHRLKAVVQSASLVPLLNWVRAELAGTVQVMRQSPSAGRLLATLLQHAEALLTIASSDQGFALFTDLVYRVSRRLDLLGQLGQARAALAAAAAWFGEWPTAELKELIRRDRERAVWLNRRGDLYVSQGRLDEALVSYEEGLLLVRRHADADVGNEVLQRDLGVSLNKVGAMRQKRGRLDEALAAYVESLALRRRLADTGKPEWQRDVSVSLNHVGGIRQAQGRQDEALSAYQESLVLRRRLAASNAGDTQLQRDLGVSLNKVAGILLAQGRLYEALEACEESLALRRRLADADASNTRWQRDLSFCLTTVAQMLAELGRKPEACVLARESLAIDERLAALAPDHAVWQQDVLVSRRLVARVCGEA